MAEITWTPTMRQLEKQLNRAGVTSDEVIDIATRAQALTPPQAAVLALAQRLQQASPPEVPVGACRFRQGQLNCCLNMTADACTEFGMGIPGGTQFSPVPGVEGWFATDSDSPAPSPPSPAGAASSL